MYSFNRVFWYFIVACTNSLLWRRTEFPIRVCIANADSSYSDTLTADANARSNGDYGQRRGHPVDEFNAELSRYKAAQTVPGNTVTDEQACRLCVTILSHNFLLAQGAVEAGFVLDDAALQQRLDALASQVGGADKLTAWQQALDIPRQASGWRWRGRRLLPGCAINHLVCTQYCGTGTRPPILLYNEDVAKNYYNQLQAGADFDQWPHRWIR